MRRRISSVEAIFLLVLLSVPTLLRAQGLNGEISGTVIDPSGASIPNAELMLRDLSTGIQIKTKSAEDGLYAFPNLLRGTYDLRVSAPGFEDFEQKGILVNLSSTLRVNVTLALGSNMQKVEVSASASALNFDNAQQSGSISPETIEELPLIVAGHARSAVSFARLLPGVASGGDEDRLNFNTRINGGMNEADEAVLDGASIMDGLLSQNGIEMAVTGHPFSPEAIQEITLDTSNYDAQFGSTGSSVTIAITKSGTDSWHGDTYELLRNTALNSREWGQSNRPKDLESDFGGNIGGPIKIPWFFWTGRQKTYAFANYEGFRQVGGVTAPIVSIPTMQERQGDFSDWPFPIYDPATTSINPSTGAVTRQQFMGCNGNTPNVICPTDPRIVNSLAPGWLKYLPAPDLPGVLNNYTPPKPPRGGTNGNSTTFDVRVDHYVGTADHISVVSHYYGSFGNNTTVLPNKQIAQESFYEPSYNFANRINWDHTFTPTLLHNLNIGYNDAYGVDLCSDAPYAGAVPQIPGVINHTFPPTIGLGEFYGYGCNFRDSTSRPTYLINDRMTWVKGRHTIGFGEDYRALQYNAGNLGNQSGTFNFSRLNTGLPGVSSGNEIASFLLGYVDNASMAVQTLTNQYARAKALGLYVSDTWKFTRKLTLNYGLRWDVSTPSKEKYDNVSFIDPGKPNPDAGNLPGSLVFAGTKAGPGASLGRAYPEGIWYNGFAPRVGFAYALTPKTVFRAGYGIFYNELIYPSWNGGIASGTDGFNSSILFSSTNGGITPALLLQDGFTKETLPAPPPFFTQGYDNGKVPGLYREFNGDKPPYMQQYNATLEHQFTNNFYITSAFVGNKGSRLMSTIAPINVLNPSLLSIGPRLNDVFQPGQTSLDGVSIPYPNWVQQMVQCPPTVAQALLPYPQFCSNIDSSSEFAGKSSYNSLQLKAEKRFSHGLWMLTSYTWSNYLSTGSDVQTEELLATGESGVISPFQRQRNKSPDSQDVPQVLSAALVYQLPFGKGQRFVNHGGLVGKAVQGWQLSTIFHASSGLPVWFRNSDCTIPGQFAMGCVPAILPGANPLAQSKGSFNPREPLFNASAFESTGRLPGPSGVLGTNEDIYSPGVGPRISNIRGFGYRNNDFGLQKITLITERVKLELRAEFFNLWNWHVFSQGTTWGQSGAFTTDLASPDFGLVTGNVTAPRNIQLGAKIVF
jgi:hypothetical protein